MTEDDTPTCPGSGQRWTRADGDGHRIICPGCGKGWPMFGLDYVPRADTPHHTVPVHPPR